MAASVAETRALVASLRASAGAGAAPAPSNGNGSAAPAPAAPAGPGIALSEQALKGLSPEASALLASLQSEVARPTTKPAAVGALPPTLPEPVTGASAAALAAHAPGVAAAVAPAALSAQATRAASTPTEWLLVLRLEKFVEKFESIGVRAIADLTEVTEQDLRDLGMPALHLRRFMAAAKEIPAPPVRPTRAATTVTQLLKRAEALAGLPSTTAHGGSYDAAAIGKAATEVAAAAEDVWTKAIEPSQWLEDFRLEHFTVNFEKLGVFELVDFTEVLDEDLERMGMPMLQVRRYKKAAGDIPNAGGMEGTIRMAAQRAAESRDGERVSEWFRTMRLVQFQNQISALGVHELTDNVEILEEELIEIDMPLLQRRRFLAGAKAAAPGVSAATEQAVAKLAYAAASATDVIEFLRAMRLTRFSEAFESHGVFEVVDVLELLPQDLDDMNIPNLGKRRLIAAMKQIPTPAEQPGRRWETPIKWLESLRLRQYATAFSQIGVDRVVDFVEVLDADLREMGMPTLQQRRFRAAAIKDTVLPTDEVDESGRSVMASTIAIAGVDVLTMLPARWLAQLRCETFLESFEKLGVERVIDFAEVFEEDLLEMGLPLLQRRRVSRAAGEAEELYILKRTSEMVDSEMPAAAAAEDAGRPQNPIEWLTEYRLEKYLPEFEALGVECVLDFVEVLPEDLLAMGMYPLHTRRFVKASRAIRAALVASG